MVHRTTEIVLGFTGLAPGASLPQACAARARRAWDCPLVLGTMTGMTVRTLGVEEEFLLVDTLTWRPAPVAPAVIADAAGALAVPAAPLDGALAQAALLERGALLG